MNVHKNARLTPSGRALMVDRIERRRMPEMGLVWMANSA
jgi:hypothetical protein